MEEHVCVVCCAGVVSVFVVHWVPLPAPPLMPIDWKNVSALFLALWASRIIGSFFVMLNWGRICGFRARKFTASHSWLADLSDSGV